MKNKKGPSPLFLNLTYILTDSKTTRIFINRRFIEKYKLNIYKLFYFIFTILN